MGNRKCFLHLALGPNYYITIWCEKVNESVWRILWNNGKRSFLDKTDPFQSRIWAEAHLLHFYFFFRMEEKKGFCEIESLLLITTMKLKTKKRRKKWSTVQAFRTKMHFLIPCLKLKQKSSHISEMVANCSILHFDNWQFCVKEVNWFYGKIGSVFPTW